MHHHVYEMSPTHAELRSWHCDVVALLEKLKRQGRAPNKRAERY